MAICQKCNKQEVLQTFKVFFEQSECNKDSSEEDYLFRVRLDVGNTDPIHMSIYLVRNGSIGKYISLGFLLTMNNSYTENIRR